MLTELYFLLRATTPLWMGGAPTVGVPEQCARSS